MFNNRIFTSSSSAYAFHTSSIPTVDGSNENQSILCSDQQTFSRNTNHLDEESKKEGKYLCRLIQSSTDLTTNHSSNNQGTSMNNNRANRIESALLTSAYSHLLTPSIIHSYRPIPGTHMNKTIDLIKHNGAGDEAFSSHSCQKEVPSLDTLESNHYLTMEKIPVHNRRTIQFTGKQLILISLSVFMFVIFLCSTTMYFIL